MEPDSPQHTSFTVFLVNQVELELTVSGSFDSIKSYVMIALRGPNEVIEVFDVYQQTTLIPVSQVAYVFFGRQM